MYILLIGAHPDDVEGNAGGCATLWRQRGDEVRFISVTDGRRGHYAREYAHDPDRLIARRSAESRAAAMVIGASTGNLGVSENEVCCSLEATEILIREIRRFGPHPGAGPDLIVTHRTSDRPRDHRYTAQLTIDAVGLLTAPLMCPETPALDLPPVLAYWYDDCTETAPFRADMIVPIDSVMEQKTLMFAAHASQVFEWLPYNAHLTDDVPEDAGERLEWLQKTYIEPMGLRIRSACAESLHATLPHGRAVEAFQISEFGRVPPPSEIAALFP